jgi:hypothetical protein
VTKIVVVTGAGRSGTSSVAGALKRLGLHIPQPEKQADEWNPRGYYESSWPTTFHAKWLRSLLRDMDARPHAAEVALASLTDERQERFTAWLVEQVGLRAPGEVVLVKETRAFWVLPMWQRAAEAAGAELTSLTMLRHPTQVVRSRDSKHLEGRPDGVRLLRETTNVAAWLNSLFETERVTRGLPRTFVLYDELLGDWRTALTRAAGHLGLDLGDETALAAPHDNDDFLDSSLNRSAYTWDGLEVGRPLVDLAERSWERAHRLTRDPADPTVVAEVAALREEYADLYAMAEGILGDARTETTAEIRQEFADRLEHKDAKIAELRQRARTAEAALAEAPAPDADRAPGRRNPLRRRHR